MSFSHAKYIHSIPTAPKVLTHSSITLKYKVSFKYPLNQIQVRFQVQLFPRQFFSPPVKPDKLKVSKVHWWDNGRIDILILKGRNRKKAMMSPKPVQNLAKQIPLDLKVWHESFLVWYSAFQVHWDGSITSQLSRFCLPLRLCWEVSHPRFWQRQLWLKMKQDPWWRLISFQGHFSLLKNSLCLQQKSRIQACRIQEVYQPSFILSCLCPLHSNWHHFCSYIIP